MGKGADLCDFDRGQIVITEGSEQVFRKMHDSWIIRDLQLLVFMQNEWMTVKAAVDDMVLDVHTLSKKKEILRLCEAKPESDCSSGENPMQCRAK